MSNQEDAESCEVEVIASNVDVPLSPGQQWREEGRHLQKLSADTRPLVKPSSVQRRLYDLQRFKETAALMAGYLPVTGAWLIWLSQTLIDWLDGALLCPELLYVGVLALLAAYPAWKFGVGESRLESGLARRVLPEEEARNLVEVSQRKRRWAVPVGFVTALVAPLLPVSTFLALSAFSLSALGLRCLCLPWKNEPRHELLQGSLKDGVLTMLLTLPVLAAGVYGGVLAGGALLLLMTIAMRLMQDARERAALPPAVDDRLSLPGK